MRSKPGQEREAKITRELSEKELDNITKVFGDNVRARSLVFARKIQENLQAEFMAVRDLARESNKGQQSC